MILRSNLTYLFISLLISVVMYPLIINLLYKFQFREKIREVGPESHREKIGTPTMGGVGFFIITLLLNLLFNFSLKQTALILVVFTAAAAFGFIEDWYKAYGESELRENIRKEVYEVFSKSDETWSIYKTLLIPWNFFREFTRTIGSNASNRDVKLKSHYKFLLHLGLGAFVAFWVYFKLGWSSMIIPFFGELEMGLLYPLFIWLFFVFTLNAVAITDGLDGLLTGLTLIKLPVYLVIAITLGYFGIANFISIFMGSLIVYLYFNIYPARTFMGDIGSYSIAAALFMVPLLMRVEFLILITHAVCLFDGGISSVGQQLSVKLTGKRIFKMAPVHHHFEVIGWPETKVTNRFWVVGIIMSLLGLFLFTFM